MGYFVVSDLHLHCEEPESLFTTEKEAIFAQLVEEVLATDSTLVIAGDCLDMIGMRAPRRAHRRFFEELFSREELKHPAIENALIPRSDLEQFQRTCAQFPVFFRCLGELAKRDLLILMPGNHDCCLDHQPVKGAFENVVGTGTIWRKTLDLGSVVFGVHGNQFDESNRTDHGCENPGSIITSAIYRALMPALLVFGVPEKIVYQLPAVRPEEAVVHGIQHHLGDEKAQAIVAAFVSLIARNNYFRGGQNLVMLPMRWHLPVMTNFLKRYVTVERLASALPDERKLKHDVREGAEAFRAKHHPQASTIVVGHTHVLDRSERYINLGTWIDHITGIDFEHLEASDNSLPVLQIETNEILGLFDARDLPQMNRLRDCRRIY